MIVGSGGCRKLRLAGRGKGKSGGYRVVTYYPGLSEVFLLALLSKGSAANFSRAEVNGFARTAAVLGARVGNRRKPPVPDYDRMTDAERIMEGLEEALAYAEGRLDRSAYRLHTPLTIGLRRLRQRLGLARSEFAAEFGLDAETLQAWEEGRIDLDAGSQTLVKLILGDPEHVRRTLAA